MVSRSVVLMLLVLAAPSAGLCQGLPTAGAPRAYVTGGVGSAFDLDFDRPSAALAVEYGERVHQHIQAYALLSYVDNLMSERMRTHLVRAGSDLTQATGQRWEFRGRDRALVFTVGARFLLPVRAAFRPYVGAGIGALNLKRRIHERDLGDVSDTFWETTGLSDGIIDAGSTSVTRPLGEVNLGVAGTAGRTYVDFAYRYRRAFHAFDAVAFSQVTAGVGVAF